MNILFVYSMKDSPNPVKPLREQTEIQYGISYISSFLKAHNHQTQLLIMTYKTKKTVIDETIAHFRPRLICFTSVASEYDFIKDIARYIKSHHRSPYLLAGGPHVTLNPAETINDTYDAICIGEGEYPTHELAEKLAKDEKITSIQNLWIKNNNGEIERNPTREFNQDLDSMPFPDRAIWQKWMADSKKTKHEIILGRGCPFQCTYCCNHAFKKIAPGKYVRFRSSGNVIHELENIVHDFPETKEIYFEVETIGADIEFAKELCSKLKDFNRLRPKPLSFGVNLRISPNIDYDRLFHHLQDSNFTYLKIGLESGSLRVRKDILKRHYSNEDILKTITLARQYHLKISTYVMIGIPGETLADFKETIACIRQCQPDRAGLSIFYPYPGTELYKLSEDMGLLTPNRTSNHERKLATLDLPEFSKREIQKQYDWFPYSIYKGRKSIFSLLRKVLYRRMSSMYRNLAHA